MEFSVLLRQRYEQYSQVRRKNRKRKSFSTGMFNAEVSALNRLYLQYLAEAMPDEYVDEFLARWRNMLTLLKPDDPEAIDPTQLPLL